MKDRIKELRNALHLTQSEFGEKIGASRDAIAGYERGVTIKEPIMKLICHEFNVNYFWLRDGAGEMFINIPDTVIAEIKISYDLSEFEEDIIKKYLSLSKDEREALQAILKKMFHLDEKKMIADCDQ